MQGCLVTIMNNYKVRSDKDVRWKILSGLFGLIIEHNDAITIPKFNTFYDY